MSIHTSELYKTLYKLAQTVHSFIRGTDITVRCTKPCLDLHDMLMTIVVHVGQPRRPELVGSMGQ